MRSYPNNLAAIVATLSCVGCATGVAYGERRVLDVIHSQTGALFNGTVHVNECDAVGNKIVCDPKRSLVTPVHTGLLDIDFSLWPGTEAKSVFLVRYVEGGGHTFRHELWAIPIGQGVWRVGELLPHSRAGQMDDEQNTASRTAVPQTLQRTAAAKVGLTRSIGGVEGQGPYATVGPGYLPGKAAVINDAGELEAAVGRPADFMTVNGTSAPAPANSFFFGDGETPTGSIDGTNRTFILSKAPAPPQSLMLFRNGVLQKVTLDFQLTASTIAFTIASTPQVGDTLLAYYRF